MLGTRIAALRREAGLSQAELAQRLQVSPSALGMYEQERREPSMQTLVKLSRELGVTTDYLLTGTPAEKERAELEGMLLGRIRAADQRLEQRRERPFSPGRAGSPVCRHADGGIILFLNKMISSFYLSCFTADRLVGGKKCIDFVF